MMLKKREPVLVGPRRGTDGTIERDTQHDVTTTFPLLQTIEDLDRLMALAVECADTAPARRASFLRVWSSLKNEQRRREGLPALAGLPAAGPDEVARFLEEVAAQ